MPVIVATGIVFAALLGLAVMHALLIVGQLRLDDLHRASAAEREEIRVLQLRVAELESPDRVLTAARERLGMVTPPEVGYLVSVEAEPAGDSRPLRVDAAEPTPTTVPEPPPPADPASPGGDDEATSPSTSIPLADDRPSEGGRDE